MQGFLSQQLQALREQSRFRELPSFSRPVDFTSNDYLGLARSPQLASAIRHQFETLEPTRNGSTGSRLLSGNSVLAENLEHRLSRLFDSEAALLFNSGYAANLAVLSALPAKDDTILLDEFVHASLKDGARLSHSTRWSFKHNDLDDLEKKLKLAKGRRWIVVESLYSMDGDHCPLQDLTSLAERYEAVVILDEAHTTGIEGDKGAGISNSLGLGKRLPVRVFTFGKAMGVHGACVTGSQQLIDYLVNFSRPFIYTTAMSDHAVVSIGASFDYLEKNPHLQTVLRTRISEFVALRDRFHLPFVNSGSQIQALVVPGNEKVKKLAAIIQEAGMDVRPILAPTVKEGTERLRICLHAFNDKQEMELLTHTISRFDFTE